MMNLLVGSHRKLKHCAKFDIDQLTFTLVDSFVDKNIQGVI